MPSCWRRAQPAPWAQRCRAPVAAASCGLSAPTLPPRTRCTPRSARSRPLCGRPSSPKLGGLGSVESNQTAVFSPATAWTRDGCFNVVWRDVQWYDVLWYGVLWCFVLCGTDFVFGLCNANQQDIFTTAVLISISSRQTDVPRLPGARLLASQRAPSRHRCGRCHLSRRPPVRRSVRGRTASRPPAAERPTPSRPSGVPSQSRALCGWARPAVPRARAADAPPPRRSPPRHPH
jgi:hypothetical protein